MPAWSLAKNGTPRVGTTGNPSLQRFPVAVVVRGAKVEEAAEAGVEEEAQQFAEKLDHGYGDETGGRGVGGV